MLRILVLGFYLIGLVGCAGGLRATISRDRTAIVTGCDPDEIEMTERTDYGEQSEYTVECEGKTFLCRTHLLETIFSDKPTCEQTAGEGYEESDDDDDTESDDLPEDKVGGSTT